MGKYRTLTDEELRRRIGNCDLEDNSLFSEAATRFLGDSSQAEYIRELEEEIDRMEKRDTVSFSEYEAVCTQRDELAKTSEDLQAQVDTLTATFDALVNT